MKRRGYRCARACDTRSAYDRGTGTGRRSNTDVAGEVVVGGERPVAQLVQHDTRRAVPAGERDRRPVVVEAEEGLAGAVPGTQPRNVGEPVRGEARLPPQAADDLIHEPGAVGEERQAPPPERGLGQVHAPALRVTRWTDRAHGLPTAVANRPAIARWPSAPRPIASS